MPVPQFVVLSLLRRARKAQADGAELIQISSAELELLESEQPQGFDLEAKTLYGLTLDVADN